MDNNTYQYELLKSIENIANKLDPDAPKSEKETFQYRMLEAIEKIAEASKPIPEPVTVPELYMYEIGITVEDTTNSRYVKGYMWHISDNDPPISDIVSLWDWLYSKSDKSRSIDVAFTGGVTSGTSASLKIVTFLTFFMSGYDKYLNFQYTDTVGPMPSLNNAYVPTINPMQFKVTESGPVWTLTINHKIKLSQLN